MKTRKPTCIHRNMITNYREYQGSWNYDYIIADYDITIGGDNAEQLLTSLELVLLQTNNWSQGTIHDGTLSILVRNNHKWSYAIDDGFLETVISRSKAVEFISGLLERLSN